MRLTRRFVLTGTAATLAAVALPAPRGWAVTSLAIGDMRIDSLSDGWLELPAALALEVVPEADRAGLADRFGLPRTGTVQSPLNVTLMRHAGRVVLFDVGSGPDFMPTAGKLAEALEAVGLTPQDVTDVLFTHAHPDHLWGVLDEFDEPLFPNARMQISAVERDFWTAPATMESAAPDRQSFVAGASRRLAALGDRIEPFPEPGEVLPGIVAVPTPGHTPGHTSYAIGSPESGVFVTGDFVTTLVGFARPDLGTATDHDPDEAAATRAATLARLADAGWTILGYHLPDGGIGRVERDGEAFRFVPA